MVADRNNMSYKDYVQKPITHDLAPSGARPKWSKGDNPRFRSRLQAIKDKKEILKEKIPRHKNGMINVAALKRELKK